VTLTLLPRVGVVGAAIGVLVGEVSIIAIALATLALPADWWASVARQSARLAVPVAGLVLVALLLRERTPAPAGFALALAVYAALALVTGAVTRDHRDLVAGVLRSGSRGIRAWMGPAS
jgi:hypothetical protein